MHATITVESPIASTPRVAQLRGLFDLPAQVTSRLEWAVTLPLEERPWNIGLITGPSGCGKSTIAKRLWPAEVEYSSRMSWPADHALIDAFPAELSVKEVTALLSSVGFSSPPAWLRPFAVLSTGQQFRATLARLLAEAVACPGAVKPLIVQDEFTSVVDRTVARIGSSALARAVRGRGLRFVAVSCHDDIIDWLQPDWVYRPALAIGGGKTDSEDAFTWRLLRRRPRIVVEVSRCEAKELRLFAPHHYLSHGLAASATCFLARWEGRPVAFSAWLPFVGTGRRARREHRTVTLPDYQGAGIGHALSSLIASMWRGLGYRATSTTTHPALIQARRRSPFWVLRRAQSLAERHEGQLPGLRHATTRLTAGFQYTGPALPSRLAWLLCGT
jgi:GNAT superfamily N-acetyltransferase/ABC-type ATPase involved in cell division